jgi:hypothetical protein
MSSDPLARYAVFANSNTLISEIGNVLNVSTVNTNRVVLDSNALDTTGTGGTATLLLNGIAIASASGLTSTIANWSYYPALSTIGFDSNGGTIVMNQGRFSNVSSVTATVSSITVSSINGQTTGQIGQTVLYRAPTVLSSQTINVSNPIRLITSFSNPLVGKTVQGVWNGDFAGSVAVSNSGGYAPQMSCFISDNNVSPYTPTNAVGGTFDETFFPIGDIITGYTGTMSNSVNIPFCFSNSPSVLNVIWSEQSPGGSTPSFAINNVSTNFLCVIGGAVVTAV